MISGGETAVERQADDESIASLRRAIGNSFPAEPYLGAITPCDQDGEWPEELDDDEDLYKTLPGLKWTAVPEELLQRQPSGFGLLTNTAFVAFFAAWLTRALDDIDGENQVREFVVYSFCDNLRQYRILDVNQRSVLRSVLMEFSKRERNRFVREKASEAVALIDWFLAKYGERGANAD